MPVDSWAHGYAGKRFFPTTISIEDPFVSDELSFIFNYLKEPGGGDEPPVDAFELSVEYTKRITPHIGISIGDDFRRLDPVGEGSEYGFGNLEIGAKYQFFTSAPHESLFSVGVGAEIGGTGNSSVEAESFCTISPAFFFGKGLGDLAESLKYFRPLAVTGVLSLNFPTRSSTRTQTIDEGTMETVPELQQNPITFSYGFAVEYSLQYLQSFVKDIGLAPPFSRMILLVELPFETGLNRGSSGETAGFINPGIIWVGKYIQLGIEAQIPINDQSGKNVGVLGIIHFFIDDIFPHSLGRPIFR
jgi:hypothetical protein